MDLNWFLNTVQTFCLSLSCNFESGGFLIEKIKWNYNFSFFINSFKCNLKSLKRDKYQY